MKRLCSLLLVICMLSASCLLFSSCSAISEDDLSKDPYGVITEATENTVGAFFTDDAEIGKHLISMLPKGSVTIGFEHEIDDEALRIKEKIYYDITDRSFVFDTDYKYDDTDLSFRIFLDKERLAANGKDVFGSDKTYLINFDKFIKDFDDSDFVEIFKVDDESVDELVEFVKTLKESLNSEFSEDDEKALALSKALYNNFLKTVSTEKTKNKDNRSVNCIVGEFAFTNETLKSAFEIILENEKTEEDFTKDTEEYYNDIIKAIDENLVIDVVVKVYLNKRTNEYVRIVADGTVTPVSDDENPVLLEIEALFGKKDILFDGSVTYDDETLSFDAAFAKKTEGDNYEYTFTLNGSDGEKTINALNASYLFNKATGDVTLSVDTYQTEEARSTASLKGNLLVSREKISLVLDTLISDDETIDFNFYVTVVPEESIPQLPEKTRDVVDMGIVGWNEFVNEFISSELGLLIYGEPGYEY
ncbi:MAG: hypothetical protein J6A85_07595 [Clostridia bacterium]|nr:hypothetical protein [Clostridia bacterium]